MYSTHQSESDGPFKQTSGEKEIWAAFNSALTEYGILHLYSFEKKNLHTPLCPQIQYNTPFFLIQPSVSNVLQYITHLNKPDTSPSY